MSWKNFFLINRKSEIDQELRKKLASLEISMGEIIQLLTDMGEKKPQPTSQKPIDPPIIIEKVNIEKIILDKFELNNNFGQLGIKELKGKLNIGATYDSDLFPKLMEDDEKNGHDEKNMTKPRYKKGPKVNIHAKQED